MQKYILLLSFVALFSSCGDTTKKTEKSETLPVIALNDFDNQAGKFIGKEVQLSGLVDHVCKHGGKKLELVNETASVHVVNETRFDDTMVGDQVVITGQVFEEFHVDEAYCIQKEEEYAKKKESGEFDEATYKGGLKQLEFFRDSMATAKSDHLSFYSVKYLSHKVTKEGEEEKEDEKLEEHDVKEDKE